MCQVGRMVVATIIQLSLALFSRQLPVGSCVALVFGQVRRLSLVWGSSPAGVNCRVLVAGVVCLKPWMLLNSRRQKTRIYTALENVKHTHGN